MLKELFLKNRSYRRFYEEVKISSDKLREWIDLVRLSPSAANLQPHRFIISNSEDMNKKIFPNLNWAGYLKGWQGPKTGERPSAYIIMTTSKPVEKAFDPGIAALAILLGAVEAGFGGCAIASFDKEKLKEILDLDKEDALVLVIALGKPKENVLIENINAGEDIKYWRDENNVHHVPKIKVKDLVIKEY
mgnify:CR=1 FL=1